MVKVLALVIFLTISGCAVFEGGKVPKTSLTAYEVSGDSKPSLSYSSTARGGVFSTKNYSENGQRMIEEEILSVLQSSEYFSRISKDDDAAYISMEITITNSGNPAAFIPAAITGLSLYLIPSWATDNFDLVATVERQDGLKKEYILADTTTLVQWLPMIFLAPTRNFSVLSEVRKNMYTKVLADMKTDGFFSSEENKFVFRRQDKNWTLAETRVASQTGKELPYP